MHLAAPATPPVEPGDQLATATGRHLLIGASAATLLAVTSATVARTQVASPVAIPEPSGSPETPSSEATAEQLTLATQGGDLYGPALAMIAQEAKVITHTAGEFEVFLISEKAEVLWELNDNDPVCTEPGKANTHLEVAVRDGGDGRFVPSLSITLALKASDGSDVGTHKMPFVWHPWFCHYGRNWDGARRR